MIAIALGKVAVPTPGTPVQIGPLVVSAAGSALPPTGEVARIEVWAVPGNAGVVTVKGPGGNGVAGLPAPVNGHSEHWCCHAPKGGNRISPSQFSIDAASASDGAYVTAWLD